MAAIMVVNNVILSLNHALSQGTRIASLSNKILLHG